MLPPALLCSTSRLAERASARAIASRTLSGSVTSVRIVSGSAGPPDRGLRGLLQPGHVDIGQRQPRPLLREQHGGRAPDAHRGTRDERDLAR